MSGGADEQARTAGAARTDRSGTAVRADQGSSGAKCRSSNGCEGCFEGRRHLEELNARTAEVEEPFLENGRAFHGHVTGEDTRVTEKSGILTLRWAREGDCKP